MYLKWDNALNIRWNGDERAVGKVNFKMGVLAVILFAGLVGVLVLCSYGLGWWALGWGILAVVLLILAAWDPLRILRRRSRKSKFPDPTDPPVNRE